MLTKTRSFMYQNSTFKIFRASCSTSEGKREIKIPKRIPRSSTDIFRALESTISRDVTAAHYKYHDDPYLIPTSNLSKRTYAMAQESGRKTAHWVRAQHVELFQHREAEPMIEMFAPNVKYNQDSQVTEDDFKNVIEKGFINDAQIVYKLLSEQKVAISNETKQSFLELLCYFNQEEPINEQFIEERWYKQGLKAKERKRKTWHDGMLAEEVFISIEKPDIEAYSAIIQGMVKYGQADQAHRLFTEALEKNLILSVDAYNSIISISNFVKESYEMRWNFILETLNLMKQSKVKPNLETLNAILNSLSSLGLGKQVKQNALKTLGEFRNLGIKPSLTSWYYILIIFCKEQGPRSYILKQILDELEGKDLKISDLKDTFFFVTAMDICHNHLMDKHLAVKVHKLLLHGSNYNLIGDSYKESIYYRHYLTLLCQMEPFEDFMEKYYFLLIPHVYVPEPSVMLETLKSLEVSGATQYLPKLFSDMIIFDHTNRRNLVEFVLSIMVNNKPDNSTLTNQFSNIAWEVFCKVNEQEEHRTKQLEFTGEMLAKIMITLLNSNEFNKACNVMEKLDKEQQLIHGVASFKSLELFVIHCIEEKKPTQAINCIQYASDNGYTEVSGLVLKLQKQLTLDESHVARLKKIVGPDVLTSSL